MFDLLIASLLSEVFVACRVEVVTDKDMRAHKDGLLTIE
jgi:hypothetical protein